MLAIVCISHNSYSHDELFLQNWKMWWKCSRINDIQLFPWDTFSYISCEIFMNSWYTLYWLLVVSATTIALIHGIQFQHQSDLIEVLSLAYILTVSPQRLAVQWGSDSSSPHWTIRTATPTEPVQSSSGKSQETTTKPATCLD